MLEIEKEITIKLKWNLDETKLYFANKGIPLKESFILKDIYMIKKDMDIINNNNSNILSSCIIIREVVGEKSNTKKIIYKEKKRDEEGKILDSKKYSCTIENIDDAYQLLEKIGYKECFRYEQECLSFSNEKVNILLEYINELGLFAELENSNKTIEQLKEDLNSLNIPYYENNYFVNKAGLMLDKIKRQRRDKNGRS